MFFSDYCALFCSCTGDPRVLRVLTHSFPPRRSSDLFGSPAPIDVQVRGRDMAGNQAYAHKLLKRLRSVPGLADARIQQSMRYPQIDVDVDRARMAQYGLDQRDVTQSLGIGLAGTSQSEIGRAHV